MTIKNANCFLAVMLIVCSTKWGQAQTAEQLAARSTLERVVEFYRTEVGYQGAYLWRYSADLTQQEGEEIASRTSGWTQPPGTPTVGEAYLKAWRLCGDRACLEAAVEAAQALVSSQLHSGGWSSHFDLGVEGRIRYAYRTEGDPKRKNNMTTFDDDKSQSALTLLMHVDEALNFANEPIHEAVEVALTKMLEAQYPNGAWPQQYSAPPNPQEFPIKNATFPKTWSRTFPEVRYINFYTLNDGNMSRIVEMLFEAHRIYHRQDCLRAATKTGEFFLLAQLPDPQPGWAQQYDVEMHPVWARKFEPASITGGESQSVMATLLLVHQVTGDPTFLKPIPKALAYYQHSLLPSGQLARFYELETNKPLFFTKDYHLTYSDEDMPTHYAFKVSSNLKKIEQKYRELLDTPAAQLAPKSSPQEPEKLTNRLADRAQQLMTQLDARGAWTEVGKMKNSQAPLDIIDMKTFTRNLAALAAYVGAVAEVR